VTLQKQKGFVREAISLGVKPKRNANTLQKQKLKR